MSFNTFFWKDCGLDSLKYVHACLMSSRSKYSAFSIPSMAWLAILHSWLPQTGQTMCERKVERLRASCSYAHSLQIVIKQLHRKCTELSSMGVGHKQQVSWTPFMLSFVLFKCAISEEFFEMFELRILFDPCLPEQRPACDNSLHLNKIGDLNKIGTQGILYLWHFTLRCLC